uniref:EGF-like domain-containing protein n=1 Tax=Oryzias latipes TaxID=8090 RepID=A0A3B3H9I7_ORYLA
MSDEDLTSFLKKIFLSLCVLFPQISSWLPSDACDPDPCENGATCHSMDQDFYCACPEVLAPTAGPVWEEETPSHASVKTDGRAPPVDRVSHLKYLFT